MIIIVIKQISKTKFELHSFKTGKLIGTFKSREAALIREKQIQYFKHKIRGK